MLTAITTIVTAVASGLFGCIGGLLYVKQERKAKDIDNERKQADEWKRLYDERCDEITRLNAKIDDLYKEIAKQRDCKADLRKDNTKLEVDITRLTVLKCEVPGCPNRKPPTGY